MNRLHFAVVGAGHLGRFHARLAASLPDSRLVAVVDTDSQAAESLADETGATALGNFRDLIGLVDAVILATPTSTHHQIARELLLSGIHVLVEKPITTTVAEAEELVELAQRQQLVLQVGHIERFNPALVAVRENLSRPKYIRAKRHSGYAFRSTDIGVVHDLMIHDLDIILSLVKSPVTRVDALGISILGDHEDMVDARIEFASGCVAQLTASRTSFENSREMQVYTDSCCGLIDFAAKRAELIEPTEEILTRQFEADTLTNEQVAQLKEQFFKALLVRREVPVADCNAMYEEQLDFARAIRTSSEPLVAGAAGCEALAVAEEILTAVRAHQWDGVHGSRIGALAMPRQVAAGTIDLWSEEDTVVLRRKAG